ncbi:MAG: carboxypeptidase-like regulatory domain-containing protein [bacterium]
MWKAFLFVALVAFSVLTPHSLLASATDGTIDGTNKYAKAVDANFGTFNFGTTQGAVHVTDTQLSGYAWSDYYGWVNLRPTGYGVINDGSGNLSGYAWGQNTGWINFHPSSSSVRVVIDSSGDFSGYAWGQNIGWIVFNCTTNSSCGGGSFKVSTDWRPASVRNVSSGGGGGGGSGSGAPSGGTPPSTPAPTPAPTPTPTEPPAPPPESVPEPTPPPPVTPPEVTPPAPPVQTPQTAPPTPSVLNSIANFFSGSGSTGGGSSAVVDVVSGAVQQVKQSYEFAQEIAKVAAKETKAAVQSPTGSVITKTVSTVGVIGGGIASASSLFLNPLSFSELFLIPFRLWGLLLAAFGLKKRSRPWGTVYDSVTKQPLDPAYVVLQNEKGEEVNTSITDLDGRYGFLLAPGTYTMVANKTNYTFPSKKLAGQTSDVLYSDLYFGEPIAALEAGVVLTKNIPLDPVNFDWNEFAKSQQQISRFYSKRDLIKKRITDGAFSAGFVVAIIAFWAAPAPYNIAIFALYIAMLLLRIFGAKKKAFSSIVDGTTQMPLAFAIVRVYLAGLAGEPQELLHKVTDHLGRFYALVPPGDYYLTVEKKNPDETYTLVHKSEVFSAKNGVIENHIVL